MNFMVNCFDWVVLGKLLKIRNYYYEIFSKNEIFFLISRICKTSFDLEKFQEIQAIFLKTNLKLRYKNALSLEIFLDFQNCFD
jgi:hypothetical protein